MEGLMLFCVFFGGVMATFPIESLGDTGNAIWQSVGTVVLFLGASLNLRRIMDKNDL